MASQNAIYGTTCNPYDLQRTSGGSSGGESALVAARGSPVGIATDVGGSIRIPAFFTGLVSLKPTVDRLSYRGIAVPRLNDRSGQREVRPTAGAMAKTVSDVELLMDVWCQEGLYSADISIPRMPWDHAQYLSVGTSAAPLRYGYFICDGWFEPAECCARAVRESVEALRAAGHEVVAFAPEEMAEAALLYVSLLAAEGNFRGFVEGIQGEALHPSYAFLKSVAQLPNWVRPLLAAAVRRRGEARKAELIWAGRGKSTYDYWQVTAQAQALRKRFLDRFEAAGIDALLCPGLALPAFPHGTSVLLNQACSYTFVWNLFNLPAGTVPVTRVRTDEQFYEPSRHRNDSLTRAAQGAMKGSAGLPIGVQVVALPWREEKCLGAMKRLEAALARDVPSPPADVMGLA